MRYFFSSLVLLFMVSLPGQSLYDRTLASLPDFYEFLSFPNDARIEGQLEENLIWLEAQFKLRGFTTRRLANGGTDLLLTEFRARRKKAPTVLFYGHLDGQSVDPSKWVLAEPFRPVLGTMNPLPDGSLAYEALGELPAGEALMDSRIFARSASDAKAPIMMFLVAWDHFIENGGKLPYHLKFIVDTEEEISSPHLPAAVEQYREELAADHLVILDGPVHTSQQPTLVYGARGIAKARLTVYGPKVPLHSGHYGNYAPNPALRLAQLLAGMKDDEGKVTIPGWYDGIELDEATQKILAATPDDLAGIHQKLGFATPDAVGNNLQEALQYPSLNIRGMNSGWVGKAARTIIPATAVANIDIRLVAESEGDRLLGLLRQYLLEEGYFIIPPGREPTDAERAKYGRLASFSGNTSYGAFRTDITSKTGRWLTRSLTATFGKSPKSEGKLEASIPKCRCIKL
ncbi:MAG: M20/M25/M40 family metallo-hydrolase, partial [Bacteroidota bacterium]